MSSSCDEELDMALQEAMDHKEALHFPEEVEPEAEVPTTEDKLCAGKLKHGYALARLIATHVQR